MEEVLDKLIIAGLTSIPGGGAEILADRVRGLISPTKCSAREWLEVMEIAHKLGLRTTATMMFGHVETKAERLQHMLHLRDLQDKTGGFTAFIPWTFQPGGTALGGEAARSWDYLKTLAVSRLVLDNIANLQVSWVTQGAKIAQVALQFGANDFGSTMLEENVVAATGVTFRLSQEDITRHITDAGYTTPAAAATATTATSGAGKSCSPPTPALSASPTSSICQPRQENLPDTSRGGSRLGMLTRLAWILTICRSCKK